MDKLPLILWSGGLDSTYLVWDHLSKGQSVDTVYINLLNNPYQSKREIKARKLQKKLFCEYPDAVIRRDIIWDVSNMDETGDIIHIQPFIWLHVLNLVFKKDRHSHIELGYVREDDFWHIASDVKRLYCDIRRIFSSDEPSKEELIFPMEWLTKERVFNSYKESDFGKRLLPHVTWCEEWKRSAKCACVSCEKMRKINNIGP